MMYSDVMHRTQIYLSEEDVELLDRQSRLTGASRSELIRRAVRSRYGRSKEMTVEEKLKAVRASAGAWEDRDFTGAEYVEMLRRPTRERRRRLGLE